MFQYFGTILKVLILLVGFFIIKNLNIPDNYKFLITIIPALLFLATKKVITEIKYKGKIKPLIVKKKLELSDKYLPDDYYFEDFTIETNSQIEPIVVEQHKPFWIERGGYLDISHPNNYITLENLFVNDEFTLEFWLRLKHIANNQIISFYDSNDKKLFDVHYDKDFLYINQQTKIPYTEGRWFHLVIAHSKIQENNAVFVNGSLVGSSGIENNKINNVNKAYLFKYCGEPIESNRHYYELCNCSVIRIYNRTLTLEEILNNFLKDAYYFDIPLKRDYANKKIVEDKSLILFLESRVPQEEKERIQYKKEMEIPKSDSWLQSFSNKTKQDTKKNSQQPIIIMLDQNNLPSKETNWIPEINSQKNKEETPNGNKIPEETPKGNKIPEETPKGNKIPEETPNNNKIPEETPKGNKIPEETPKGNKIPEETPKGVKDTNDKKNDKKNDKEIKVKKETITTSKPIF